MGIRARILEWLHRGDDHGDPDEFVELTTVRLHEGPLLVARLEREGIEAFGQEAFDFRTETISSYRVLVRRRDLEAGFAASSDASA